MSSYLASGDEGALQAAYELGREALDSGLGPLVLFSIHRDVLLAPWAAGFDSALLMRGATTFFTETLAPFQMVFTTVDETRAPVTELRSLIGRLAGELGRLDELFDEDVRATTAVREARTLVGQHLRELDSLGAQLDHVERTADARRRQIADIVSIQEQERHRLAGEIHDDALQAMSAVLMRLGMVSRRISDPGERAVIEQLEASAREAIRRLRRLLAGLQPPELERFGLTAAVRSALERLERDFAITCSLSGGLDPEPDPDAATVAFRIIQEAIANARKHAQAARIDVALETSDGGVLARVTDDGVGFDPDATISDPETGHLGLTAMRERAALSGGQLTISSRPGETTVEFWLPDTSRTRAPL